MSRHAALRRVRWSAAVLAVALVVATCTSETADPPQAGDPPPSTVPASTTTSEPGDPPQTTDPPPTTATCADPGRAWTAEVDLDDDGLDETIILEQPVGSAPVVLVCIGENPPLSVSLAAADVQLIGFHDLDGDGTRELLFTQAGDRGRVLSALTVTLRGIEHTTLVIETWNDLVDAGGGPFTGETFQCIDWDEDGVPDLIHWSMQPADDLVNVRAQLVTLEGTEAVETAVDLYETSVDDATAILGAPHGCGPDDVVLPNLRFSAAGWARVPLDPTVFDATEDLAITGAAATDERIVAVGVEAPNPIVGAVIETRPRAWWSTDGVVWNAATVPGESAEMLAVTATADGFFAVGAVGESAAVWTSQDGSEWTLFEVRTHLPDGAAVMYSIASAPFGLVAVGAEMYWPDIDAAVWISPDGATWTRVLSPSFGTVGFQPNEDGEFNGEMVGVAVSEAGTVVAVGVDSDSDPNIDFPDNFPAAWVSTDGETWQRTRLSQDTRLRGVAAFGDVFVAFGTTDVHGSPTADAVILRSTDGATWSDATGDFAGLDPSDGIQVVSDVLPAPDAGWIAVGTDQTEFDSIGAAAVWQTFDLASAWERLPHDPTVWGEVDAAPVLVMNGGAVVPTGTLLVTGFVGETLPLPGGGSACCLDRPRLWLFDPARTGS